MRKLLAILALIAPVSVSAQRIQGRVVEAGTDKPVRNVEVRLENADGPVARVVTDSLGRFILKANAGGTFRLSTNHIAFAPIRADLDVATGDLVELLLRVSMQPTELAPLEVIARGKAPDAYLERTGFYDRKAAGFGVFMTLDQIERKHPMATSDLFQGISGVRVFYLGITGKDIRMTRGEDPDCPPRIIVDNTVVRKGGRGEPQQSIDNLLQPNAIQGIEIYRSASEVPQEFGGLQTTCGVVLIWTKRGSAR